MYMTKFKKIAILLLLLMPCMASFTLFAEQRTHVVKAGETLYRLHIMYNVSVEAIQKANPNIVVGTNVPTGAVLVIPSAEVEPVNEAPSKVETVVAKAFEAAETTEVLKATEGLRPIESTEPTGSFDISKPRRAASFLKRFTETVFSKGEAVTVAFILPFNLASKSVAEDKQQMRAVEFYQGALVAINKAQNSGMKVRLLTYDTGTRPLYSILADSALLEADLIVPPFETPDIREVANFAEEHGINVLNPFKLVPDLVDNCSHLFQLNTYISELYPQLTADLKERFSDYAFVFLSDSLLLDQEDPYATYLKNDLKESGITYFEYAYGSPESILSVDSVLNLLHSNIFFVPTANDKESLRRFFPSLQNKIYLEAHPEVAAAALAAMDPERAEKERQERAERMRQEREQAKLDSNYVEGPRKMAILGYPDWQLYFMENFYDMNVWMFCKFYVDPFDTEVSDMYNQFRFWYAREMLDLYPKYGMLGYDVTNYGLQMLRNYGHDFGEEADGKYVQTLQSAMLFRRSGEGGFVNKGLYLVHFTPDSRIEKFEVQ